MARKRKQFLLRIPPELYDVYERWAGDEFRSVNAQIEAVLVDAARQAGRAPWQRQSHRVRGRRTAASSVLPEALYAFRSTLDQSQGEQAPADSSQGSGDHVACGVHLEQRA